MLHLRVLSAVPLNPIDKDTRVANSLASGMLYNVTNGRMTLAKHLCRGVGVMTMTESEKVCNILHNICHAISNSLVRIWLLIITVVLWILGCGTILNLPFLYITNLFEKV